MLNFSFDLVLTHFYTHTNITAGPKIIVRTEEVLIVLAILILWIGAIALFFNRWGKIRMLEPYQPKFQQQHRSSCPLVEMESIPAHKPSFSRCSMGMSLQMPPGRMGSLSGQSSLYTVRGKLCLDIILLFNKITSRMHSIYFQYKSSMNSGKKNKHFFLAFSFCSASPLYSRNRQNSVFVGPQVVAQKPSRKYRSAMDIHSMVLDEAPEPV